MASVPWLALLVTLATLVLGGWVADSWSAGGVLTWVPWLGQRPKLMTGVLSAALVLLAWRVYLKRRELTSVGALSQADAEPRRALVVPLSPGHAVITTVDEGLHVRRKPNPALPDGACVVLQGCPEALESDIERLAALKGWPWQQVLRAIRPHQASLTHLYILGSAGTRGSHHDMVSIRALLEPYLPGCRIITSAPPVDFDDLKSMMHALRVAIRTLTAERIPGTTRFLREEDIMIDVTGGYKPTSIAGAVMTLTSNVTFQYVHTGGEHLVREYDLLHRGPPQG